MKSEIDSWEETLEILANKGLMKRIKKSREDVKKGKLISREELERHWKKEHGKI
jgi:PHD/YefM family antitoxin component YafN of YafNO toxin-antitoxin module